MLDLKKLQDAVIRGDAPAARSLTQEALAEGIVPLKIVNDHTFGAKVRLHICGNTRRSLADMGRLGCDIVDLDSLAPMGEAREQMGSRQVLLGNLNPVKALRDGNPSSVSTAVEECHRHAGPRFIVGAGCEVPRDTPVENLRALYEYAHCHTP